jgi:hypothetical protein
MPGKTALFFLIGSVTSEMVSYFEQAPQFTHCFQWIPLKSIARCIKKIDEFIVIEGDAG